MNLTPDQLTRNGFVLLDSLHHKELVPFVRLYLKKKTRFSLMYTGCNFICLLLVILWFWTAYTSEGFTIGTGVSYFSCGLAVALALIPLHEYLHVLAYRSQGASQTSYDANLKKFYFMAMADKFVASRSEFQIVALTPFITISSILIAGLFFVSIQWSFTLLGTLLAHTAMCSGDFGLLSYFDFHKHKEVVTYDDKENGVSYFLGK